MSDYDLKVLTDHLLHLADRQHAAGNIVKLAEEEVSGLSASVLKTHGASCLATRSAVAAAEAARQKAADNTYQASMDLEDRLKWAAENYNDADWVSGENVASCGI